MEAKGKSKYLVTKPSTPCNMKGGMFEVESYHHFTNPASSEEPIKSKKDDRRNLSIRCSDEKKGDYAYFDKDFGILEKEGAIKSLFK